jgi:hypothetical protein
VTAGYAATVVEDNAIQLASDGRAGSAAGDTTNKATKDRAGETAKRNADGATDNAKCRAGFCTGSGSGNATGGSRNGAYGTAGFAAVMCNFNASGVATRAKNIHESLLMGRT